MTTEEILALYKKIFDVEPIDRTETFSSDIMEVDNINIIPKFDEDFSLNISECILKRAEELKNLNKNVYLLLSGGIDSTTVFYGLIDKNIDFSIIYNSHTKLENPNLWNDIQNKKYKNVKNQILMNEVKDLDKTNSVFVTGEISDQLFGHASFIHLSQEQRNMNYKKLNLHKDFFDFFDTPLRKIFGDSLDDFTVGNYIWSLNFCFKYAKVVKRIPMYDESFVNAEMFNFYQSDFFQQWALHNYKTTSTFDSFRDYKMPLKEFIFSYNNDLTYKTYKTKTQSLNFGKVDNEGNATSILFTNFLGTN